MSSVKHYRYVDNNANVVGFATLDINDNILVEYEIDIPVSPYAGDLRCKDLQLLKPILRGDRRLSPIIRRGTINQQAIIIVHPTSFKKLVLPTIPRSLDGVYLCLTEVGLDGELKIPGPVYNDVALDNRVQFPILKIDQMNFYLQTRLAINHDIRAQIQLSRGNSTIKVTRNLVSKEVMNMLLDYIPDARCYMHHKSGK
jgi:hypothetical protein